MANDIICEISSAGEIVVEINGMTYQSVAAELAEKASVEDVALKADKTYVDDKLSEKADKTYVDNQDLLKADKATTYTKTEVDTSLGSKAEKQQEAWITPTLLNGYTAGSYGVPQYMKDQFGFVHFRGVLNGGTPGQKAFDTIAGYRPPIATIWLSSAGYNNFNIGYITASGSFVPNRPGATGDTGLEQITYKVGA